MKTLPFTLVSISLLAVLASAYSQDDRTAETRKPLNNPMYSTHNYKHPNLAAAARRWETKKAIPVEVPRLSEAQLANYKRQMPIAQPVGGITVGHTPSTNLADRNYKIQRLSEPKPLESTSEYYVKKEQRRNSSSTLGE